MTRLNAAVSARYGGYTVATRWLRWVRGTVGWPHGGDRGYRDYTVLAANALRTSMLTRSCTALRCTALRGGAERSGVQCSAQSAGGDLSYERSRPQCQGTARKLRCDSLAYAVGIASLRCGRLTGVVRVAVSAVGNHSKIMRLPVLTGLAVLFCRRAARSRSTRSPSGTARCSSTRSEATVRFMRRAAAAASCSIGQRIQPSFRAALHLWHLLVVIRAPAPQLNPRGRRTAPA